MIKEGGRNFSEVLETLSHLPQGTRKSQVSSYPDIWTVESCSNSISRVPGHLVLALLDNLDWHPDVHCGLLMSFSRGFNIPESMCRVI